MSEKPRFHTLLELNFRPFWHQCSSLFRCLFLHRFLTSFWGRFKANMVPKWVPKSTQNRSKNASEKSSKKDVDLQRDGVFDLVSKLVGRKAQFVRKLGVILLHLTCALPQVCRAISYYWYFQLFPTIPYCLLQCFGNSLHCLRFLPAAQPPK